MTASKRARQVPLAAEAALAFGAGAGFFALLAVTLAAVDSDGGLRDRLAVLDGRLRVESPADGGTLVAAVIPLADGR